MSLLQAHSSHLTAEAPARGCSDLVRPPRAVMLNQNNASCRALDPATAREALEDGAYTRLPVPAVVVYRIEAGEHHQTGVLVEASVRDYREGRIRRHEATDPARERVLDMSTADNGFEQLPVTLTHACRPKLTELLAEAASGEPHLDVGTSEECRHSVWIRQDAVFVRAVLEQLATLDTLYIADGHHRIAAAERYGSRRSCSGSAFTLASLFPSEQMRVFGYNRSLSRPAGYSTGQLLDALEGAHHIERIEPYPQGGTVGKTPGPGTVAVYLDSAWYRMVLSAPDTRADTRDSLDAVRLDEGVLASFASAVGLDPHTDLTPVPSGSAEELVRSCDEQTAIGFVAHPPSVEAIMAVSDAGRVMPPKSTWFAPKTSAGLFLRELT